MTPFTLVLPYYENASMLRAQQVHMAALPGDVRTQLHLIVVDDGSPESPAAPHWDPPPMASARLFRTGRDVRWNWLFCRNLGVSQAQTEWLFLTDIDHLIPEATWRRLMAVALDPARVYRCARVDAPHMTAVHPHPNTWVMTREMFDRVGGYDERFSGFYGTDGEFRRRVEATVTAPQVVILPQFVVRYSRNLIADADTLRYGRKEPQDVENVRRILAERSAEPGWTTKRLTFPWELVCTQ